MKIIKDKFPLNFPIVRKFIRTLLQNTRKGYLEAIQVLVICMNSNIIIEIIKFFQLFDNKTKVKSFSSSRLFLDDISAYQNNNDERLQGNCLLNSQERHCMNFFIVYELFKRSDTYFLIEMINAI